MEHPQEAREWFHGSNIIVLVAVKDLHELQSFARSLDDKGVKHSKFIEEDVGNELTAVAIAPGPDVKRLCSGFKLVGKK
jgi:hypothetical protein